MNDLYVDLAMMVAVMDDEWVERWAEQFGYTRRPPDGWYLGESMSEFRARVINDMARQPDMIGDNLELGHEIDVVTGEIYESA